MEQRKKQHQYTWNKYVSYCKRLCPKDISFDVLTMVIPFYQAYKNGVHHRTLMCEIDHVFRLDWLTPEQRKQRITAIIGVGND